MQKKKQNLETKLSGVHEIYKLNLLDWKSIKTRILFQKADCSGVRTQKFIDRFRSYNLLC